MKQEIIKETRLTLECSEDIKEIKAFEKTDFNRGRITQYKYLRIVGKYEAIENILEYLQSVIGNGCEYGLACSEGTVNGSIWMPKSMLKYTWEVKDKTIYIVETKYIIK